MGIKTKSKLILKLFVVQRLLKQTKFEKKVNVFALCNECYGKV